MRFFHQVCVAGIDPFIDVRKLFIEFPDPRHIHRPNDAATGNRMRKDSRILIFCKRIISRSRLKNRGSIPIQDDCREGCLPEEFIIAEIRWDHSRLDACFQRSDNTEAEHLAPVPYLAREETSRDV